MTVAEFWSEQYRVVVEEKKTLGDKLRETLEENKDLQARINNLTSSNETLRGINSRIFKSLASSTYQTQELKTQLEGTKEGLDKVIADRNELQADRDFWVHDSTEKTVEIQSLKTDLDDAKKQLEEIKSEFKQSYADGYSDGNEEGQNELWEMLQNVRDMNLLKEFDPECECLGDVIDMDLEDFKEAYGKWEAEQKKVAEEAKKQRVEYMRDYLKKFCVGKLCFGCPLYNASEPVSSCLFSKLTDEEVEERYKKVIESDDKKITAPISARLPQPWECTIEGTVEINEDILKVVCGIKTKEEEHKLEYGDAVRLPWRDYDYMYIGPDEKEETLVHLFDPENHAIVTTHISNVRYNGGRILVSEEDDIRKIWKYMK